MFALWCLAFVDIIGFPSDTAANIRGSGLGPASLRANGIARRLNVKGDLDVYADSLHQSLERVYHQCLRSLADGHTPLVMGGDHSVAIGSVAATQRICSRRNLKLGVLWCDAHADFNTLETSSTKNIHGMSLAVLCGDTLPHLQFGPRVQPKDVLQFGVRDVDPLERIRVHDHFLQNTFDLDKVVHWSRMFDAIHVSFDMDVLDPTEAPGVSTPVPDGMSRSDCIALFEQVKHKTIALDMVELNPLHDESNRTAHLAIHLTNTLLS